MQIIKQREKPVDAMQEKINPMHNKADQLLDPAQKEAKLKEIKKADKELDCLFQSSRKVQGQLRQLRPVALERYTALQWLHNFSEVDWKTVQETHPKVPDHDKANVYLAGLNILVGKWEKEFP